MHKAAGRKFDGVAGEIEKDLPDACGIAADMARDVFANLVIELQAFFFGPRFHQCHHAADEAFDVEAHFLEIEFPGLHLGEVENVIEDGQKRLAGIFDSFNVVLLLPVEPGVFHQRNQTQDAVQWSADFVAHGGEEG